MRVLQVVAYLSKDGSYGGPTSVAVDQCSALTNMGHTVTLGTGWDGRIQQSFSFRVFRFRARRMAGRSFASLLAPSFHVWLWRHAREFDVAHVHLARDAHTLPAAYALSVLGVPFVVQTHGMIRPDSRLSTRLLDALLLRRVLRRAKRVLALTDQEDQDMRELGVSPERIRRVPNGVPLAGRLTVAPSKKPLVLYSSRLAPRKRPLAFVSAAALVLEERSDVRFELWGPDEGELEAVSTAIDRLGIGYACAYRGASSVAESRERVCDAAIFVLPSFAEPFPVSLLEALSAGVPSVITRDTGLSELVHTSGAGLVTDGSPEEIAASINLLLGDRHMWQAASLAARGLAETHFSMRRIGETLLECYR